MRISEASTKGVYFSNDATYATADYIRKNINVNFKPTAKMSYREVRRWGNITRIYDIADAYSV